MRRSLIVCVLALCAAGAAALGAAATSPAAADGWHRWHGYSAPRHAYRVPRYYRPYSGNLRYYNSPSAYRSACSYGDCGCLRSMALRTGNQVWWDKYQACSGN